MMVKPIAKAVALTASAACVVVLIVLSSECGAFVLPSSAVLESRTSISITQLHETDEGMVADAPTTDASEQSDTDGVGDTATTSPSQNNDIDGLLAHNGRYRKNRNESASAQAFDVGSNPYGAASGFYNAADGRPEGSVGETAGDNFMGPYSRSLVWGRNAKLRLRRRVQRNRERNRELLQQRDVELREDGYAAMFQKQRAFLSRILRSSAGKARKVLRGERKPGTLILLRHGESVWNANQTFTGWADPDMSERGLREMEHAARLLLEGGYEIDVVFTSRLKRAIRSVWILLQELNEVYLPVFKSWRLNERMYGALTGLSKKETAQQIGTEIVQRWRGSLDARPPFIRRTDSLWPGRDRRYVDLTPSQIPLTESLQDCMERTNPIWADKISFELRKGRNVLVLAHANTLRGLVKTIDGISDDEIQEVAIPTGIPIVYRFDKNLIPVPPHRGDDQTGMQYHMNGLFLSKPGLLAEALKRETEWKERVPGYDDTMAPRPITMTPLERSLSKLRAERELGEWAGQFLDQTREKYEDDGNDGNMGKPIRMMENEAWDKGLRDLGLLEEGDEEEEEVVPTLITSNPCVVPTGTIGNVPIRDDAVIVIIRHGKTEHNKLGLFTGWEDVPLAPDGVQEARDAGRLLKQHGFEFDVVYTSWLSRAIETAWYVMDEMDCTWLPIIKSWRLNERMYGALTSLSKRMVAQRHGEKQFKAWRRGYKIPPPPVSSFSSHYPGNDKRYRKYLEDVPYSISESLIRSIEARRFVLHRKLPKTESLKDCMDRTIPYFTHQIVPEAINQGKRVLISSSENAIRGLLMRLCNIPEDRIVELEIPNGLPLIFDVKSQCVKLLDDGTGRNPLDVYNFGKAASYLFRPCTNEDGSLDEECDVRYLQNDAPLSRDEILNATAMDPATLVA